MHFCLTTCNGNIGLEQYTQKKKMSRLKISIINRDIVYLLIFFVLFVSAHSQERDKEAFTLMRKITKYDAEGLKYVSITKKDCIALKTCYYTRKGDSIDSFSWKINEKTINTIRDKILSEFVVNDYTYASGKAIILLMAVPLSKSIELRLIKGLSPSFNKELIKVLKKIECNIVFTFEDKPIIFPFAVELTFKKDSSHISNQNIKRETEFNSAIWLNKAIIDNEQYRQIKDKSFWKKNDSMGVGTTIKGITKLKSIKIEFQGKIRIYQTNDQNAIPTMGSYGHGHATNWGQYCCGKSKRRNYHCL